MAGVQSELSLSKKKVANSVEMCNQYEARIEELVKEQSRLKSRLTEVESQREANKTFDVSRRMTHVHAHTHTHTHTHSTLHTHTHTHT